MQPKVLPSHFVSPTTQRTYLANRRTKSGNYVNLRTMEMDRMQRPSPLEKEHLYLEQRFQKQPKEKEPKKRRPRRSYKKWTVCKPKPKTEKNKPMTSAQETALEQRISASWSRLWNNNEDSKIQNTTEFPPPSEWRSV